MQPIAKLLQHADDFRLDKSLRHNHISCGVVRELQRQREDLLYLQSLDLDDADMLSEIASDLTKIDQAIKDYTDYKPD